MIVVRQKGPARAGLHQADACDGVLHVDDVLAGGSSDLGQAPFAQRIHVIADDAVLEGVLPALALELEHQTFAQVARADTDGVKRLHDFENLLDSLLRDGG